MTRSQQHDHPARQIGLLAVMTAILAGVAAAGLASIAFAKSSSPTLSTAHNAKLGKTIVVGKRGLTVYELSTESTRHLICKSTACFGFWPPLKVSKNAKLKAATGIKGKLSKLHRDGFYQVTLGGSPLYYFEADKRSGDANGQGIKLGGGTWHAIAEGGASKAPNTTTTTTSTTTTSSTTTPAYTYPNGY